MEHEAHQDTGADRPRPWPLPGHWVLGLFCIAVGGGAIWIARDYPYGTLTAMGPGFVPTAIAAILVFLGIFIVLGRGRDVGDEPRPAVVAHDRRYWLGLARAMILILGGIVFFGVAIRPLGLAISTFALVVIVRYARADARWWPVLVLASAITAATCVVFIVLLGLEISAFPRFDNG